MKCCKCSFEQEQEFSFCPQCGAAQNAPLESETLQPVNAAAQKVLKALQNPLFFVLCILTSVSCAAQLIESGPNVISILFTIYLWLVYAKSRKGIADVSHLRAVSGTVYAQYIVVNVVAIFLIVVGGICGLAFGALMSDPSFLSELTDLIPSEAAFASDLLASASGVILFVVFALLGGLMLVFNWFSYRRIHRFAKSVYKGVESGTLALDHAKSTCTWLYVLGIFSGISLLGNLSSGDLISIASGCASCAAPIIAAVLIKQHLMTEA